MYDSTAAESLMTSWDENVLGWSFFTATQDQFPLTGLPELTSWRVHSEVHCHTLIRKITH